MIDIIISQDMIPVLVTLFLLALVTLSTIAYVSKERFFTPVFVLIPAVFLCVYVSWATVSNLLGYPVATDIPNKSIYLAHVVNEEKNVIYVWVKAPADDKPRLFEIPKTQNNEKQMAKSKQKAENGVPQELMKKAKEKKGVGGRTRGGEYMTYDFNVGHEQFKYGGQHSDSEFDTNAPQLLEFENMSFIPAPIVPPHESHMTENLPFNVP